MVLDTVSTAGAVGAVGAVGTVGTVPRTIKRELILFGRVWDFEGRSAEICQIDWKGPR